MTAPHLGPGHAVAGKYTIRQLYGFTGEVATYHAVSQQGQEVILKLYDPALAQRADAMAQLEQVRAKVAAMPADMVLPVLESGYDSATGAPYSVTEWMQVPSLAQLLHAGPLSPDVAATIMHGVAQVLDTAHGQHLFHHALKPTNIFVGPAPQYAVRIADFDASAARSPSPTHEAYANSAPWWAPEQLQPAAVLGGTTDVFSAALVAFFLLTGRSYWASCQSAPPDLTAWQSEVMGPRVAASQRATELGSAIDPALDGLFSRALSVNLLDRPTSVSEIANALGPAQLFHAAQAAGRSALPEQDAAGAALPPAGQADQPTPGLPPFPLQQEKKRSKAFLPVLIGVGAAILLAGGVLTWVLIRPAGEVETEVAARGGTASASSADVPPEPTASNETTDPDPDPDDASGEGGANGMDEAAPVEVRITCVPVCERVRIDNQEVADLDAKLELAPGKHKLVLFRTGYRAHQTTVQIESGQPFEKKFKLSPIAVRQPRPRPRLPRCGQFLKTNCRK